MSNIKELVKERLNQLSKEDWFHSFAGNTNLTFNPLNTDIRFEVIGNIHDNPELLKGKNKKQ